MAGRIGSVLVIAVGVLWPAAVFGQSQTPPPGMPNMDELMRQAGSAQGGRQHSASAAAPGVPIPPDSPLMVAFKRLDAAKAYRVVMEMSTTDPRAQQAMQQMGGMDRYDKVVVKPDTQAISLHMKLPSVVQPGKSDDWEVKSVTKGGRAAKKFDTPAKEKILAMQEASIAKQFAQADMSAAMSLAQAAAGGPAGLLSGVVQAAALAASHAQAARASWYTVSSEGRSPSLLPKPR